MKDITKNDEFLKVLEQFELLDSLASQSKYKRSLSGFKRPMTRQDRNDWVDAYENTFNRSIYNGEDVRDNLYYLWQEARKGYPCIPETDCHYESFDPRLNPELQQEYDDFMNNYENKYKQDLYNHYYKQDMFY